MIDILKIECAVGNVLPNSGYIEVSIRSKGIPKSTEEPSLLLIVPDTEYNRKTPILLATYILSEFVANCEDNFGKMKNVCTRQAYSIR